MAVAAAAKQHQEQNSIPPPLTFSFQTFLNSSLGSTSTFGSKPLLHLELSSSKEQKQYSGWWFALCRETSEVQQHMVDSRLHVVDLEHGKFLFC